MAGTTIALAEKMEHMTAVVRQRWNRSPVAGVILGTGLDAFADQIVREAEFGYEELPHFGATSALGHRGRLVCGTLEGRSFMAFQGRFHLYEGCSPEQAALPVRLLQAVGARVLVTTNAAGGLNPQFAVGDVMVIEDHINLMFANPLVGINDDRLGPRFPDMSAPYDRALRDIAMEAAHAAQLRVHCGVYVAMRGPTYETRAEYRFCRRLGGDAVGMSTVPEVLAARHAGMGVVGFSVISNTASPDALTPATGHDVLTAATKASDVVAGLIRAIVKSLPESDGLAVNCSIGRA